MPRQDLIYLQPSGWQNDPEEERLKVSTLDYLAPCTYNGHSFFVQWFDADGEEYPSLDDIEKAHFSATILGDLNRWSVPPMTYGEKPEAHPDNAPIVAAYKANFVRGWLVFIMHHHHYSNDVMGWVDFTHQLAENCRAVFINDEAAFPTWDPSCLDRSRLIKPEPPEDVKIDGPPPPQRHPDHTGAVSLLFHLPKSKAAELKKLATPSDGSWVSTYDAFSAFIWRTLSRLRAPVFKPDMSAPLRWFEAVDMRRRLHSPKCPPRIQCNVMYAATSPTAPFPQPTAAEVIEWPLLKLASYIRRLTNSVMQESLDQTLNMVAIIRGKMALSFRINSEPLFTAADFGFATPGVIIIYPPRRAAADSDEGCEFSIAYEKSLAQTLIGDLEWSKYFEYRGVDAEDAGYYRN
ncbi:hypothetical protein BDV59DRAFT_211262 [Aspergillus ambiguus]|uniref:uncharacterized protein n=1 Tax=Aspergillus ambiguus TaxID=176160 RepID=UPI003CCE183B